MTKITFIVVSISTKANTFGLSGHILIGMNGTAYEVARSNRCEVGQRLEVTYIFDRIVNDVVPQWHLVGVEIPRRLADPQQHEITEAMNLADPSFG